VQFLIFLLKPQTPPGHRVNDGWPLYEIMPGSRRTKTQGNLEERVHRIRTTTFPDPWGNLLGVKGVEKCIPRPINKSA
jgi:hypothetical protein